jgi:pimeloyl-ACP methyl ester carboxylesterase
VLDFAARHPARAVGLVLVDGGYIDLQSRPNGAWEEVAEQLRPPPLTGMPRAQLKARIRGAHPDWSDAGLEATLANFETMADDTVRPWLTLDNHMQILRAMWEQRPGAIYADVELPVLLAVAEDDTNPEWMAMKRRQVAAALAALPTASIQWFAGAAHDIHVHRPDQLADVMLEWSASL